MVWQQIQTQQRYSRTGDWDVTADKLPDGINALVQAAEKEGVKFGLWIEPEMVNPKSELFEKYPDWAIHYPNRETYYYRNQLVLDLSNPRCGIMCIALWISC